MAEFNAPDSKTNDSSEKVAMIECLILSRSPSPKAQNFLSDLLDNPKYGVHVAERMGADGVPLSVDALDRLVVKLDQDTNSVSRANYAGAISAYGKQAQRYTPRLQKALASESDKETKATIQKAIDKINR